jgi:lysophospholipase L1-like esterase
MDLHRGQSIAIIGGGIADRLQHDGWLETLIEKAYPQDELVIRNLAFSGDEVVEPEITDTGKTREQWLATVKADVILAFYGFNESFAGADGLATFKQNLDGFLKERLKATYNGTSAPRLVLLSPTAAETMPDPNLPDPSENNRNLAAYTQAMAEVAKANQVRFVDLFTASQRLYAVAKQPLTFNGVHLTSEGDRLLAPIIVREAFGVEPAATGPALEKLRAAVVDKSETWHSRYRTVDSYNIFGGRSKLSYESGKVPGCARLPQRRGGDQAHDHAQGLQGDAVRQRRAVPRAGQAGADGLGHQGPPVGLRMAQLPGAHPRQQGWRQDPDHRGHQGHRQGRQGDYLPRRPQLPDRLPVLQGWHPGDGVARPVVRARHLRRRQGQLEGAFPDGAGCRRLAP